MSIAARLFCILIALLTAGAAAAAENRGQWFKSLLRPGTGISCCDISDCRKTDARWQDDGWWAVVLGKWRPIPPESVLTAPRTLDGEAYVCAGDVQDFEAHRLDVHVYCFVPPDMGS